jgi:hypothetical protein
MQMSPTLAGIIAVSISLLTFAALFLVTLKFFRWYSRRARDGIEEMYKQFQPAHTPSEGNVHVIYHTYSGLIAWFVQMEHSVYLPPTQARSFLRQLRNYNLKWGLLSYGCLFIPILTFGSYLSQLRDLKRQEDEMRLRSGKGR